MNLNQLVASAAISAALGATGIDLSSGMASAAPGQCPPMVQCGPGNGPQNGPPQDRNGPPPDRGGPPNGGPQGGPPPGGPDFRGPGGDRGGPPPDRGGPPGDWRGPGGPPGGPDFRGPDNHDWRPPWNPQDNDWRGRFRGAPWGDGLPPWGWGAPPPPAWDGPLPPAWGPPPPPINYFGYNEQPVWDQGSNQWGFWFFGIWIPLPF
jgi:hypothetical protein